MFLFTVIRFVSVYPQISEALYPYPSVSVKLLGYGYISGYPLSELVPSTGSRVLGLGQSVGLGDS